MATVKENFDAWEPGISDAQFIPSKIYEAIINPPEPKPLALRNGASDHEVAILTDANGVQIGFEKARIAREWYKAAVARRVAALTPDPEGEIP